jgi:hypothetical protein
LSLTEFVVRALKKELQRIQQAQQGKDTKGK